MKFFNDLLEMPLFLGIVFLLLGMILYFFPPKKINFLYGYKTNNSMKSQQNWDFAQRFSSIKMMQCGIASILIYFTEKLFNLDNSAKTILDFSVLLACIFYIIFFTEKALKSKFPSN
jgi:uncharacterized membrane protein